MSDKELFADAYAETHLAAESISVMFNTDISARRLEKLCKHLRTAFAAANALNERYKGYPPPKTGE